MSTTLQSDRQETKPRQMKLGAFMYPAGHHVAAWRHPDVSASATSDFSDRVKFAQAAERAKFDLIFLADGVGVGESRVDALSRVDEWSIGFEPITLLLVRFRRNRQDRLHRLGGVPALCPPPRIDLCLAGRHGRRIV